jgi:hypothetical protein
LIEIRQVNDEDITWINQHYERIGFVPSNLDSDVVLIASYCGEQVGLGRIVKIE